ncbi:DUF5994 family protein [Pseudonocardia yunnanensis]|uniref:DUF5994 family protein n=1 Tax=Pseudonocardia yunnanensis TaxID=58107 RepID=A0ABW4F4K3_9PSEU
MTSVRITPIARSPVETGSGHREHLRLTVKPTAPATGVVDGGWWPRSRNLAAEVPALLSALADRLGAIEGVSYNPDDWEPTPSKIIAGGGRIRLGGYRSQRRDTIDVYGRGQLVTLLVVAPEATAPVAQAALRAAGHRGNTDGVEALLSASAPSPTPRSSTGSSTPVPSHE